LFNKNEDIEEARFDQVWEELNVIRKKSGTIKSVNSNISTNVNSQKSPCLHGKKMKGSFISTLSNNKINE